MTRSLQTDKPSAIFRGTKMTKSTQSKLLELTLATALVALSACGKDNKRTDTLYNPNPTAPTGVNNPGGYSGTGNPGYQYSTQLGDSLRDVHVEVDPRLNEFRLSLTFDDWESRSCIYVGALQGPINQQFDLPTVLNFVPNYATASPYYALGGNQYQYGAMTLQQQVGAQFSGLLTCSPRGCTSANVLITRRSPQSGENSVMLHYEKYYDLRYRPQFYNQGQPVPFGTGAQYPQFYQWFNQGGNNMNVAVIDVVGSGKQFFQLESNYYNGLEPYYGPGYRSPLGRTSRSFGHGGSGKAQKPMRITGLIGQRASLFMRDDSQSSDNRNGKFQANRTKRITNQEANVTWNNDTLRIEFVEKDNRRAVIEATVLKAAATHSKVETPSEAKKK